MFVGSGDVATDMRNQAHANNLRIRVLQETNTRLQRSVEAMLQSNKCPPPSISASQTRPPPTLAWVEPPQAYMQPVALWKYGESDYSEDSVGGEESRRVNGHRENNRRGDSRHDDNVTGEGEFVVGRSKGQSGGMGGRKGGGEGKKLREW